MKRSRKAVFLVMSQAQYDRIQKAADALVQVINDLIAIRYPEAFRAETVQQATERIKNLGGTLAYAAGALAAYEKVRGK